MLFVALTLSSLLAHIPALSAGFTYDDEPYVVYNRGIRSFGEALASFGQKWPPEDTLRRGIYRPLTQLSYAVDHAVAGGLDPRVFHASSLILYALTLPLLFLLARRYLGPSWAQVATLLFAFHPVHCEVVDSVTGRSEQLVLLFGLLAWYAFLRFESAARRRWIWLAGASIGCFLAAAAKENGVMFLAVLACHVLLSPLPETVTPRARWLGLAAVAAVLPIYIACRVSALPPDNLTTAAVPLGGAALATRIFTVGTVFGEYLRLLLFPVILQVDPYYKTVVGISASLTMTAVVGLAVALAGVSHVIHDAYRWLRDRQPASVEALLIACFFALYLPASQIVPIGTIMAERLMFSPSVPFLMLTALALARGLRWAEGRYLKVRAWSYALLGAVLVLFGLRSYARAGDWKDEVTLWTSMLAHAEHRDAYVNLGVAALRANNERAARAYLDKALELGASPYEAFINFGSHAAQQHRMAEALVEYRRALRARPGDALALARIRSCESAIATASVIVERDASVLEQTVDVQQLRNLGGACVVVGDYACANRATQRLRQLTGK